jgi:hypothetical protein
VRFARHVIRTGVLAEDYRAPGNLPPGVIREILRVGGWGAVRQLGIASIAIEALAYTCGSDQGDQWDAREAIDLGPPFLGARVRSKAKALIDQGKITMPYGGSVILQDVSPVTGAFDYSRYVAPWDTPTADGERSRHWAEHDLIRWFLWTPPPWPTPEGFVELMEQLTLGVRSNHDLNYRLLARAWSRHLPWKERVRRLQAYTATPDLGFQPWLFSMHLLATVIADLPAGPSPERVILGDMIQQALMRDGRTAEGILKEGLERWLHVDPSGLPVTAVWRFFGLSHAVEFGAIDPGMFQAFCDAMAVEDNRNGLRGKLLQRLLETPDSPARQAFVARIVVPECLGSTAPEVASLALAVLGAAPQNPTPIL